MRTSFCCFLKQFSFRVMSVSKKRTPSPVLYSYWARYSFFRNGRYWNIKTILISIQQVLSCLLNEWIAKNVHKIFLSRWLFEIINIICFEMHIDGPDKSISSLIISITFAVIFYGWFPTRKTSKLTFVCFQLLQYVE